MLLSWATRRGGRQTGGDCVPLHSCGRATRVVLKRELLKEGDTAATDAGMLGGGHGLPGDVIGKNLWILGVLLAARRS